MAISNAEIEEMAERIRLCYQEMSDILTSRNNVNPTQLLPVPNVKLSDRHQTSKSSYIRRGKSLRHG